MLLDDIIQSSFTKIEVYISCQKLDLRYDIIMQIQQLLIERKVQSTVLTSELLNQMYIMPSGADMKKTFVFEKEQTNQSVIVDEQLDLSQNEVNIQNLLSLYCPQTRHKVSIYDPHLNKFSLIKTGSISRSFFDPQIILIRFKNINGMVEGLNRPVLKDNIKVQKSVPKRMRIKERTIVEVIRMIKEWRFLNTKIQKTQNHRLTLDECSKRVGISKKSLDDYYCQLRLGELYNFDFANRLYQKMGVLRNYINRHRSQRNEPKKCLKYPKKLKIIESFDLETRTIQPTLSFEQKKLQQESSLSSNDEFMQECFEDLPNCQPFLSKTFSQQSDFFNIFFEGSNQIHNQLNFKKDNWNHSFELGTQNSSTFFNL